MTDVSPQEETAAERIFMEAASVGLVHLHKLLFRAFPGVFMSLSDSPRDFPHEFKTFSEFVSHVALAPG